MLIKACTCDTDPRFCHAHPEVEYGPNADGWKLTDEESAAEALGLPKERYDMEQDSAEHQELLDARAALAACEANSIVETVRQLRAAMKREVEEGHWSKDDRQLVVDALRKVEDALDYFGLLR